jgi:hypothetical protein
MVSNDVAADPCFIIHLRFQKHKPKGRICLPGCSGNTQTRVMTGCRMPVSGKAHVLTGDNTGSACYDYLTLCIITSDSGAAAAKKRQNQIQSQTFSAQKLITTNVYSLSLTAGFHSEQEVQTLGVKISFSNFSQRFSTTTSYLKRRFSQGDLSGEDDDVESPGASSGRPTSATPPRAGEAATEPPKSLPAFASKSNVTSAPSSPTKGVSSFLSRATSITSSVTSNVAEVAGQLKDRIKEPGRQRILLVIDDNQTDW